jgi:kynurenine 3-monooxygenase
VEVRRRVRRQHQVLGGIAAGTAALLLGAVGLAIGKARRRS